MGVVTSNPLCTLEVDNAESYNDNILKGSSHMGALVCPLCGVTTALNPVPIVSDQAYLPKRSSDTQKVYERAMVPAITDDEYPQHVSHGIFICQACGQRFVAKKHRYDDSWIAVYPIPHKPVAEEIPEPVRNEFQQARLCFVVEAYIGCLLVCRTALIAVQRDKGVTNLKELKDKGFISDFLYKQADEVRLWANIVGHEDTPGVVVKDDCDQLLAYIETLLNAIYVEPKRLSSLTQKREQIKSTPKTNVKSDDT